MTHLGYRWDGTRHVATVVNGDAMQDRLTKLRPRIAKAHSLLVTLNQPPDVVIELIETFRQTQEFLKDLDYGWGTRTVETPTVPVDPVVPGIPLGEVTVTPVSEYDGSEQ